MDLIDTHTHLNLKDFEADRTEVIQKALAEGLTRMVIPGVSLESCFSALELCERYPGLLYCGIGIHPQDANTWSQETAEKLRALLSHPAVVAVGETGLDYYWDSTPPDLQIKALRQQIYLAQEFKKPLILHVRDKAGSHQAYDDLLNILRQEQAQTVGGVMHCFSGDQDFANASIALGFYLAFGGIVTFRNAHNLQTIATQVPLSWLLVETDSPWLAPVPFRGRRNEPAYVRYVVEKLAELRQIPVLEIARQTTDNARRLFRF